MPGSAPGQALVTGFQPSLQRELFSTPLPFYARRYDDTDLVEHKQGKRHDNLAENVRRRGNDRGYKQDHNDRMLPVFAHEGGRQYPYFREHKDHDRELECNTAGQRQGSNRGDVGVDIEFVGDRFVERKIRQEVNDQRGDDIISEHDPRKKEQGDEKYPASGSLLFTEFKPGLDKTPYFPESIGKREKQPYDTGRHQRHFELPSDLDILQLEINSFHAEPIRTNCLPKLAHHPVGPELGLAWSEYDRTVDPFPVDPGEDCKHYDRAERPDNMPSEFLKMFQEGHFLPFIYFAIKILI